MNHVFYVFMTKRQRHLIGVAVGLGEALRFSQRCSIDTTISTANGSTGKKFGRLIPLHEFLLTHDAVYAEKHRTAHFMD